MRCAAVLCVIVCDRVCVIVGVGVRGFQMACGTQTQRVSAGCFSVPPESQYLRSEAAARFFRVTMKFRK